VGLAIDEHAYDSVPGKVGDDDTGEPQQRKLVYEGTEETKGIHGSLGGQFLQVLPDYGRSYPPRGRHLTDVQDLVDDPQVPYVQFTLRVQGEGWHILFVRWTGGDQIGGGDSFYVTLHEKGTKKKALSKSLMTGQRTLKPALLPINNAMESFAGCCYNPETHASPCYKSVPSQQVCNSTTFINTNKATEFGAQCRVGPGVMEIVSAPKWYLYAGQDVGNIMDFDSQPWDATCEAEGSNTADSGHDFPSWYLTKSEYQLRIYAREDGTALDAIYVAGPDGSAPGMLHRYKRGDSTVCEDALYSKTSFSISWLPGIVLVSIMIVFVVTERGRQWSGQAWNSLAKHWEYFRGNGLYLHQTTTQSKSHPLYERIQQLYEDPTTAPLHSLQLQAT